MLLADPFGSVAGGKIRAVNCHSGTGRGPVRCGWRSRRVALGWSRSLARTAGSDVLVIDVDCDGERWQKPAEKLWILFVLGRVALMFLFLSVSALR